LYTRFATIYETAASRQRKYYARTLLQRRKGGCRLIVVISLNSQYSLFELCSLTSFSRFIDRRRRTRAAAQVVHVIYEMCKRPSADECSVLSIIRGTGWRGGSTGNPQISNWNENAIIILLKKIKSFNVKQYLRKIKLEHVLFLFRHSYNIYVHLLFDKKISNELLFFFVVENTFFWLAIEIVSTAFRHKGLYRFVLRDIEWARRRVLELLRVSSFSSSLSETVPNAPPTICSSVRKAMRGGGDVCVCVCVCIGQSILVKTIRNHDNAAVPHVCRARVTIKCN